MFDKANQISVISVTETILAALDRKHSFAHSFKEAGEAERRCKPANVPETGEACD